MPFIDANEVKIRNLLSNTQEAYKVPLYQRPYAEGNGVRSTLLTGVIHKKVGGSHKAQG